MATFADYILQEKDYEKKIQLVYMLQKRDNIFFDKSVVFKTDIAKRFIERVKLDVDENLVLTACLLYSCKKDDSPKGIDSIKTYAKESAEYLKTLGFDDRFCKMCEEHNRYNESTNREYESDILEIIDQFGGMLLQRPERQAFSAEDAITILEHRNLKGKANRFLERFKEFLEMKEDE